MRLCSTTKRREGVHLNSSMSMMVVGDAQCHADGSQRIGTSLHNSEKLQKVVTVYFAQHTAQKTGTRPREVLTRGFYFKATLLSKTISQSELGKRVSQWGTEASLGRDSQSSDQIMRDKYTKKWSSLGWKRWIKPCQYEAALGERVPKLNEFGAKAPKIEPSGICSKTRQRHAFCSQGEMRQDLFQKRAVQDLPVAQIDVLEIH